MNPTFLIKVGASMEGLLIEELHKVILVCGPKTSLQISLTEDQFIKMIERSEGYSKDLMLTYSKRTETDVAKLYRACAKNSQL